MEGKDRLSWPGNHRGSEEGERVMIPLITIIQTEGMPVGCRLPPSPSMDVGRTVLANQTTMETTGEGEADGAGDSPERPGNDCGFHTHKRSKCCWWTGPTPRLQQRQQPR